MLLAESGVGYRRIRTEGVVLIAGLCSDAILAAELECVEPPDKQEKATLTVLEQAEQIAKDWVG